MDQLTYKVIELTNIYTVKEKHYFTIKINYEQKSHIFNMKVDPVTYNYVSNIVEFGKTYKYRLSFRHVWDSYSQKYYSTITRISGEETLQLFFECSEAYANHISKIKEFNEEELNNLLLPTSTKTKPISARFGNFSIRLSVLTIMLIFIITLPFSYTHILSQAASQMKFNSIDAAIEFNKQVNSPSISNTGKDPVYVELIDIIDNELNHIIIEEIDELDHTEEDSLVSDEDNSYQSIDSEIDMNYLSYLKVKDSLISHLPEGYVALTFDDGPSKYTKEIVDILLDYQIGATFFFIGVNVQEYPDSLLYAHEHGMSIANHSWKHDMLTRKATASQEQDILSTNQLMEEIINQPVRLFRPPYGAKNDQTLSIVERNNMSTVLWNRDPQDWRATNSSQILNYFKQTEPSGGIYLLHENALTLQALPQIIQYLQSKELEIVILH